MFELDIINSRLLAGEYQLILYIYKHYYICFVLTDTF